MLLERSFIAIEQGNFRFILGILEFPASLRESKAEGAISRNSSFYFRNSSFLGVRGVFEGILKFLKLEFLKKSKNSKPRILEILNQEF